MFFVRSGKRRQNVCHLYSDRRLGRLVSGKAVENVDYFSANESSQQTRLASCVLVMAQAGVINIKLTPFAKLGFVANPPPPGVGLTQASRIAAETQRTELSFSRHPQTCAFSFGLQ